MVSPAFRESLVLLGFDLDSNAIDRLALYRDRIAATAKEVNITAVREPAAIEARHLIESLALLRAIEGDGFLPTGAAVIDIGSGAGLPGLPIKIARPDIDLTLLEVVGKKCAFLRETVAALALENVTVVEGRAEEAGRHPSQRARYDVALARAVAPLPVLLEYAMPFLKVEGRLIATKGSAATRELDESQPALEMLGGSLEGVSAFEPPDLPRQTLIVVRKAAPTPDRYPRRTGIPSKRPLS